jgi:hypothetical protein
LHGQKVLVVLSQVILRVHIFLFRHKQIKSFLCPIFELLVKLLLDLGIDHVLQLLLSGLTFLDFYLLGGQGLGVFLLSYLVFTEALLEHLDLPLEADRLSLGKSLWLDLLVEMLVLTHKVSDFFHVVDLGVSKLGNASLSVFTLFVLRIESFKSRLDFGTALRLGNLTARFLKSGHGFLVKTEVATHLLVQKSKF